MRHRIVMVTSSYPRFPGDTVGTFLAPIAAGLAARGHEVHVVAPWHPRVTRGPEEGGVRFHWFRYAPLRRLQIFGYAEALEADVRLRRTVWVAAPLALAAGWLVACRVGRVRDATVMHGHWVVPGGVIAAAAAAGRPVVVSLHGSDVYVAERHRVARIAARWVFSRAAWVTACSRDLAERARRLGAPAEQTTVVPYGVDANRFKPDEDARRRWRGALGLGDETPLVVAVGRFVRKKGFEYLLDAVAALAPRWPGLVLALAGAGDLVDELRNRAARLGIADTVRFLGLVSHAEMPSLLAAADLVVVPSVRDDAGNVDGLPNVVLEALASGTPLVATPAGGIAEIATDGETALIVPERDPAALARAMERLLAEPEARRRLGDRARTLVAREHDWSRTAARFEAIYDFVVSRAAGRREGAAPIRTRAARR